MSVVSEGGFLYPAALRFENKDLFVIQRRGIEIQFIISFLPPCSCQSKYSHESLFLLIQSINGIRKLPWMLSFLACCNEIVCAHFSSFWRVSVSVVESDFLDVAKAD